MSDMSQVIVPKSDQLNSDDLIAGPITITISGVTIKAGQDQPIAVSYEGDNGKPYKPCKSMCRAMVMAWGPDAKHYAGRRMTLYRDASVKWGGMEVGGIRISHMSHIENAITMALTVTRGNKKPFTVKPLSITAAATQSPGSASAGTSGTSADLATSASSAAPDTLKKIAAALEFAGDTLKKRFQARLDAAKVSAIDELAPVDQEAALTWLKAQIDKQAVTT